MSHQNFNHRFLHVLGLLLIAFQLCMAYPFVERVSYTSEYLSNSDINSPADYLIYLPPGYDESEMRYPTIYYLHGMTDNMYTDTCQAGILDGLIRDEAVNPMIVVYVNITSRGFYNDNGPGDMEETFIIEDLIPHIDETYRTLGTAEGRAIAGFSMGGYGAINTAFRHSELFTAVLDWDGALLDQNGVVRALEDNIDDIKGRMSIKMVIATLQNMHTSLWATLDRLDVDYDLMDLDNTNHVGTLGERGPTENRTCYDPTRIIQGWEFFSESLDAPVDPVAVDNGRTPLSLDLSTKQLNDVKVYTPAGKYVGTVQSLNKLPGRGMYIVKSSTHSGQLMKIHR